MRTIVSPTLSAISLLLTLAGCSTSKPAASAGVTRSPDMAEPAILGGEPDLGSCQVCPGNRIMMVSPEPFSSEVLGPIVFEVDVSESVLRADVEGSIELRTHAGKGKAGAFSWQSHAKLGDSGFDNLLTFTPNPPLPTDTDFVIVVTPTGSFKPHALESSTALRVLTRPSKGMNGAWLVPFSTGSNPRVEWLRVVGKDEKNARYVRWRMSEVVDTSSIKAGLNVTSRGKAISGSLDIQEASGREFIYIFDGPVPFADLQTFSLDATVKGVSGTVLNLNAWDSPTSVQGRFTVPLGSLPACTQDVWCLEWQPAVNL